MTDATALTEEEFIGRARCFLHEVGGVEASALDPDADLVEAGILDSLLLIAFFSFVEGLRGQEREVRPEDLQAVSTLRSAYTLTRTDATAGGGDDRGP